jgi:hypothetical protein
MKLPGLVFFWACTIFPVPLLLEESFCIFSYAKHPEPVVIRAFLTITLFARLAAAQDTSNVDAGRLALFGGVAVGTVTAVHIYQQQAWWQGSRGEFWMVNDWGYSRGLDKLGHMYGAYFTTYISSYVLQWCGLPDRKSLLYGSITAMAFQFYVEIEDGFHDNYGFSAGDFLADVTGAALPLAQYTFPVLQNLSLKWSYWPSKGYLDDVRAGQARAFIDDYEGQAYWLAIDPHFLMGEDMQNVFPSWLGIAVGRGVTGLKGKVWDGTPITYISLDYNFSRIKTESAFLKGLFRALDFFHLPAPGIAIESGKVTFGVLY